MDDQKLSPSRRAYDVGMRALVWLCAGLTCALLVFLIGYIFYRGIPGLTWELLTGQTSYIKNTIGILPNILNTLYIILVAMVIVLPLGVGAALLLRHADGGAVCLRQRAGRDGGGLFHRHHPDAADPADQSLRRLSGAEAEKELRNPIWNRFWKQSN